MSRAIYLRVYATPAVGALAKHVLSCRRCASVAEKLAGHLLLLDLHERC